MTIIKYSFFFQNYVSFKQINYESHSNLIENENWAYSLFELDQLPINRKKFKFAQVDKDKMVFYTFYFDVFFVYKRRCINSK